MTRREKLRDDRDFDTTQLRESSHGHTLHRDYSAHFFRWSFAKRYITAKDDVLEIGCGEDKPLSKILTRGAEAYVKSYLGVDLNPIKPSVSQRLTFMGEFNVIQRYKELLKLNPQGFDVVVHLEVIEHMRLEHGAAMLCACQTLLKTGGIMLMSTPCYDGIRHAANHIHEYTVAELEAATVKAGFEVVERFGTFMDIKHIGKPVSTPSHIDANAVKIVRDELARYFDNDALSCIFAPMYPDVARNNFWVCRKKPTESNTRSQGAPMAMTHFDDVMEFNEKFGHLRSDKPRHLTRRKLGERIKFLQEELDEFKKACDEQDIAEQADALIDLVYVAIGSAVMLGLPWQELWDDVHAANMRKIRGVGKRGNKVDCIKPAGWRGPATQEILALAGYTPVPSEEFAPEFYHDDEEN